MTQEEINKKALSLKPTKRDITYMTVKTKNDSLVNISVYINENNQYCICRGLLFSIKTPHTILKRYKSYSHVKKYIIGIIENKIKAFG